MQSKVKQETLREHNIANFFMQKYHIIKFMNSERLISLRSNENIKEEYDNNHLILFCFLPNSLRSQ